jgi:hypothetical protein
MKKSAQNIAIPARRAPNWLKPYRLRSFIFGPCSPGRIAAQCGRAFFSTRNRMIWNRIFVGHGVQKCGWQHNDERLSGPLVRF